MYYYYTKNSVLRFQHTLYMISKLHVLFLKNHMNVNALNLAGNVRAKNYQI